MSARQKGAPTWWTNDDWATPQWFVDRLARQFCEPEDDEYYFDLDPGADTRTSKARKHITLDANGLTKKWRGRVFVNPPFSNPAPWVRKAALQIEKGNAEIVVMIIPASVGTAWFHTWVLPYAEIHYIKGRIAFLDWKNRAKAGTRGEHLIAVYRSGGLQQEYATLSFDSRK